MQQRPGPFVVQGGDSVPISQRLPGKGRCWSGGGRDPPGAGGARPTPTTRSNNNNQQQAQGGDPAAARPRPATTGGPGPGAGRRAREHSARHGLNDVTTALGQPEKMVNLGKKQIYVYKDLKITFVDGKVTDVQ
jgi:hypothetical protein